MDALSFKEADDHSSPFFSHQLMLWINQQMSLQIAAFSDFSVIIFDAIVVFLYLQLCVNYELPNLVMLVSLYYLLRYVSPTALAALRTSISKLLVILFYHFSSSRSILNYSISPWSAGRTNPSCIKWGYILKFFYRHTI